MEQTIKKIRDLTFIVVVYLYFVAWVYIHFYYQQFGISTSSVKIDYNSYLMYSYNVLTSSTFLFWVKLGVALTVLQMVLSFLVTRFGQKSTHFSNLHRFQSYQAFLLRWKHFREQYSFLALAILFIVIFPLLFRVSRQVALQNYQQDRKETSNLKAIQFLFRQDADIMSPARILDSSLSQSDVFYKDMLLLKNDSRQLLRLLGESDQYYIVLHQRPYNSAVGALPSGLVYYVNKKDVLLSKVILRSQ